ncbi:hypothetical protein Tco_0058050 [Tanacetum coccineum]
MTESKKPLKKKDQIIYDQEVALNLQAQLQAELKEEEERLTRQKEEEANIALIESWDNTQAMMELTLLLTTKQIWLKQKIDDDQEEAKMKKLIKVVSDEEEVAIDAIPLATKPPSIIDWKIVKEGKISLFQIIRANRSSKRYSLMIQMLKDFDREDVGTLWKLVKAKHGSTRPEEGYERVLWGGSNDNV